jgi:ABC-type Fe3+-hydroxamate transport system substrate-binding protein
MRVVSLVPSSTETLLHLGADVVACTRFCEQPRLRHIGGTKNPEIDAIVALSPDVVVLDREENRQEDAVALRAAGLELFVSDVTTLGGALEVVRELATLVGGPSAPDVLPIVTPIGLSVFVPIWRRPWMSINGQTYGASLLAHLGCTLVTAELDVAYPEVGLDQVQAWAPDVVAVPSEPYEFTDAHLGELHEASPDSSIVRIDGQDLFWWGSRTPGAITRLHAALS